MKNESDPDFDLSPGVYLKAGSPRWMTVVFKSPLRFLFIPLLVIILVLSGILIPLWLPLVIQFQKFGERKFERKMRAKGRFRDWQDLEPELIAGRGTLVIEQAQKAPIHFWWTPDDIVTISPVEIPDEEDLDFLMIHGIDPHPFVPWCHRIYLDETTGSAQLTRPAIELPPGFGIAGFIKDRYPGLSAIDTVYCLRDQLKPKPIEELL